MRPNGKPIVHLICNAHIDPVWKWPWEEGAREAISTFRTAADLLDEYPEFIFNHNESVLYEWVEDYDPPLFERIRALVRAGRWNISGGWYLQPDVNLPGGETLVRCILEGRRYFAERFGVRPAVAYNFDSFGHAGSLPQLLEQSGFQLYIHCRPIVRQMPLPGPLYRWRGVDGSTVLALRPASVFYCTPNREYSVERQDAVMQARTGIDLARSTGLDVLVPWGLGDHGGGPTRADLDAFRALFEEMAGADVEVRHSTPEAYLARVQVAAPDLPLVEGELQRTAAGCYTSVAPIKRRMRQVESLLASAERWAAIAWWREGRAYPAEALREAWKRQCFNTFHDVLPGSLIEDALPGVMDMFGFAADTARRIIAGSQSALLPNVAPRPGTVPLYVLNPHSAPLRGYVGANFLRAYHPAQNRGPYALYDDAGRRVIHQERGGSPILDGSAMQPFLGFVAEVPPLSARRYEIRFEDTPLPPSAPLSVSQDAGGISVQNTWWTLRFDRALGALAQATLREDGASAGRDLLRGPARLVVAHDTPNAWGGIADAVYSRPLADFAPLTPAEAGAFVGQEGDERGQAVRVLHQGPVAVTVECLTGWQHTRASLRVTLYADLPQIDFDVRLHMQARQKMIKLVLPFDLPDARAWCEVPYGVAERAADTSEHSCLRWVRLDAAAGAAGVANNGAPGFDASADGTLGLSLSRGAVYSCGDENPTLDPNRAYTFMDQETIETRFRLVAGGDPAAVAQALALAALELNHPLEHFFSYHAPARPADAPARPAPFLAVEPPTVILGALKKADYGDALIVRLHETAGAPVHAELRLEGGPPLAVDLRAHQVKTLRIMRQGKQIAWEESDLLER